MKDILICFLFVELVEDVAADVLLLGDLFEGPRERLTVCEKVGKILNTGN